MATLITKNSSTASSVPTAAQLVQGELAVNVTDKRLFTENSSGTVVELGTNPSTLALPNGTANGVAYLNGSKVLTTGSALTFDGTNLALTTAGAIYKVPNAGGSLFDTGGNNGIYILGSSNYIASYVAGSEAMRLTSTGLGIGTSSPGYKLGISGVATTYAASASIALYDTVSGVPASRNWLIGNVAAGNYGELNFAVSSAAGGAPTNSKMTLDSSGNLGLGVTPSAWNTSFYRALQVGAGASIFASPSNGAAAWLSANAFFNSSNNNTYITTAAATQYRQLNGEHSWYTAPSGTAGNAITFTQAMTLDSDGNLALGRSSVTTLGTNIRTIDLDGIQGSGFRFRANGTSYAYIFGGSAQTDLATLTSTPLIFSTNATERARITSGGAFLVGGTSVPVSYSGSRFYVAQSAADYSGAFDSTSSTAANNYGLLVKYTAATPNGTGNHFYRAEDATGARFLVRSNGGIENYSANDVNLSDRREKTNFAPAKDYLDTICAIPVQTFNYIDQSEDDPGLTLGVVAQDVQAVAPELVMESNWGTEENPKMRLSIYQTDLQYALMKALQELKAEFDAYKATHP